MLTSVRGGGTIKPTHSIRHNNQTGVFNVCKWSKSNVVCGLKLTNSIRFFSTPFLYLGRWLTTFQARWHPSLDIFCSGSMNQPRCMEIFDLQGKLLRAVTGESLSSVMSRTCFHPSATSVVMVGGNSSGRMVAVR